MSMPFFTVIITTYNRSKILSNAIDSVLCQSYKNFELIIVDDASTDNAGQEVSKYKNEKLFYIKNENNIGLPKSRNVGIKNAKGRFIIFLDDDDIFLPNRLETQKDTIEKDGYIYKVYYCGNRYKKNGRIIDIVPKDSGDIWGLLMKGWTPPVSAQCFARGILLEVGGYDYDISSGVDHDIWMKLGKIGLKTGIVREALASPNPLANIERMSTDYNKRINGIIGFLSKWKKDIIKLSGQKMFRKFYRRYLSREYLKFGIKFLLKKDFLLAIRCTFLGLFYDPMRLLYFAIKYFKFVFKRLFNKKEKDVVQVSNMGFTIRM